MLHLINTLERIGNNAQLKAATLKTPSGKLHFLGVSHSLTNALITNDRNKLARLTQTRKTMCCFIQRPPTMMEVFNKSLHNLAISDNASYIPDDKSIA